MIVDETKKAQLIQIQIHTGGTEYCCVRCGAIEDWAKVEVHEKVFVNKKIHYKPLCPHCKVFGGLMLQSALERIY